MREAAEERPQSWRLFLLGVPHLLGKAGRVRLERRPAAVLAHVALEGASPKSRLADWLWPDSAPDAARANMRQLLRRLRLATGSDLLGGADTLALASDLWVDRLELQTLAFQERDAEVLDGSGELLEGFEFDDAPDFAEWLAGERERLLQLRRHAAAQEAARRERAGDFTGALTFALRGVQLEPLSEDAHRTVMRLHYLQGDRGAALAAYERCRAVLREALATEPLAQTQALARDIMRGGELPTPAPAPRAAIPLAVLRPPVLVGREEVWRRMEEAWQAGQVILLSGESGAGKTRLAVDFASSKGKCLRLEARPGDQGIPYATAARVVRGLLLQREDGAAALPGWATRELARLVPELAPAPPPLASDADKLRFYDAVVELHRARRGADVICLLDDVQFTDGASVELTGYLLHALSAARGAPRFIGVFRRGELDGRTAHTLQALVDAGVGALIEVPPLSEAAVGALLSELALPAAHDQFAARLTRYTGGNPLFVVETLKHLYETGLIAHGFPEGLAPPERAATVVRQRLRRLSQSALQVARAASVLQSDLHLELIAQVLNAPLLDVVGSWDELEAAQIVRHDRFCHDIVREAVSADIPQAVRRVLHRASARVLGERGDDPARVARHWQDGGEALRAAPLWLQAARNAAGFLQFEEAMHFYEQAAQRFEEGGLDEAAFEARATVTETLWLHDLGAALDAVVERLLATARTPAERARAHAAHSATLLVRHRRFAAAEQAALRGLAALPRPPHQHTAVRAELLRLLIETRTQQGRPGAARDAVEQAVQALRDTPEAKSAARLDLSVGAALLRLWRDERALKHLERSAHAFDRLGDAYGASYARSLFATALEELGQREQAAQLRRQVEARLGAGRSAGIVHYFNAVKLGVNLTQRHQYALALRQLRLARELQREAGRPGGVAERALADLYWVLGELPGCKSAAERALGEPEPNDDAWGATWIRLGQVFAVTGRPQEAHSAFERAEQFLAPTTLSYSKGLLCLARAALAPPEEALSLTEQALTIARADGHAELLTAALAAHAEALLMLGRVEDAATPAREAVERLPDSPPRDDLLRPLLVQHRVRAALNDPQQLLALTRANAWLGELLAQDVPPEHAEAFLMRPTHATIRALAGQQHRTALPASAE